MKLRDLDPRLRGGDLASGAFLVFDCPACSPKGDAHGIRVPLAPKVDQNGQSWQHSGEFPDTLTLSPSINAGCWHGWIENGEITQ